jgi:uncharacterized protein (TIGR02001 family)
VTLTTDYIFRGVSQTDGDPAIQGGFDYAHTRGFYAGVWASNVNFNENEGVAPEAQVSEANIEIDLYAGFSRTLTVGLKWDLGAIYYAYPGTDSDLDYDYLEFYLGLNYPFELITLRPVADVKVYYSPDSFGVDIDETIYAIGSLDFSLPAEFSLGFHLGYEYIDDGDNYSDWKVGVSKNLAGFDLEVAYFGTGGSNQEDLDDSRVVFSVSRTF